LSLAASARHRAISCGSNGSNTQPFRPAWTNSGQQPLYFEHKIGNPHAIASGTTKLQLSSSVGMMKVSAAA
jgi:hypothetical protein